MSKPRVHHVHSSAIDGPASTYRRDDLVVPSDCPYDAFFWPDRACSAVSVEDRPPFDEEHPPPSIDDIDFVATRVVTDRYRDAIDAFADIVTWMRAERHSMRLVVSARDVGLARLIDGGVPPEIEVVVAEFSPAGRVDLTLHFNRNFDYNAVPGKTDVYDRKLSMVPHPLKCYRRLPTHADVAERIRLLFAPTVHIRVNAPVVRRDVYVSVCWDFVTHPRAVQPCGACRRPVVLSGPSSNVEQQRLRLLPLSDADGKRDYTVLPPHKKQVYDDGCFCRPRLAPSTDCCRRWRAAQHLLISVVLTLGAAPMGGGFAHLPLYVLLWIFDMVPGATLFNHGGKVRTIEGVLASMRRVREARAAKRLRA
jgi:hypothetical protein